MKIWVNGTMKEFTDRLTISGLLNQLAVQSEQAAVELNLAILDRADFSKTVLKDGDKLEIIRFVGGG
jgi:thiamine biosynthesis protein ThiS